MKQWQSSKVLEGSLREKAAKSGKRRSVLEFIERERENSIGYHFSIYIYMSIERD